jgi:hypothetical protein
MNQNSMLYQIPYASQPNAPQFEPAAQNLQYYHQYPQFIPNYFPHPVHSNSQASGGQNNGYNYTNNTGNNNRNNNNYNNNNNNNNNNNTNHNGNNNNNNSNNNSNNNRRSWRNTNSSNSNNWNRNNNGNNTNSSNNNNSNRSRNYGNSNNNRSGNSNRNTGHNNNNNSNNNNNNQRSSTNNGGYNRRNNNRGNSRHRNDDASNNDRDHHSDNPARRDNSRGRRTNPPDNAKKDDVRAQHRANSVGSDRSAHANSRRTDDSPQGQTTKDVPDKVPEPDWSEIEATMASLASLIGTHKSCESFSMRFTAYSRAQKLIHFCPGSACRVKHKSFALTVPLPDHNLCPCCEHSHASGPTRGVFARTPDLLMERFTNAVKEAGGTLASHNTSSRATSDAPGPSNIVRGDRNQPSPPQPPTVPSRMTTSCSQTESELPQEETAPRPPDQAPAHDHNAIVAIVRQEFEVIFVNLRNDFEAKSAVQERELLALRAALSALQNQAIPPHVEPAPQGTPPQNEVAPPIPEPGPQADPVPVPTPAHTQPAPGNTQLPIPIPPPQKDKASVRVQPEALVDNAPPRLTRSKTLEPVKPFSGAETTNNTSTSTLTAAAAAAATAAAAAAAAFTVDPSAPTAPPDNDSAGDPNTGAVGNPSRV